MDERSGQGFEAENFDLSLRDLRIAGENRAEFLKKLSFKAEFACREIRTQDFILSDVKFRCNGKDGIFAFDPVKTQVFEGQGSGNIVADLARPVPHYTVSASLAKFKIEDYFKTLSSAKVAEGAMDFSAGLTMSGNTAKELKQSAEGEVSLSGENLTLYGHDLDREFARYQSSQNFNLWDVGAYFFTGPLGLAAMKGYNFANVLKGSGGSDGMASFIQIGR